MRHAFEGCYFFYFFQLCYLREHCNGLTFIIVSLKEGMFNHANVLYKTKFCDGTSQVTRTTNKAALALTS
ncbi:hypothetical protein TELCIR_05187 [Teladorsagia circumcincta]|uniref:Uncharacterized protein n=1 Tax=Teladorsagia circumcincta TaxID=45464 RepID=A0A2G9URK3_TELCI|nr:hypothetical protein TELCIR_05187 [Teladorsagia circumcincta]